MTAQLGGFVRSGVMQHVKLCLLVTDNCHCVAHHQGLVYEVDLSVSLVVHVLLPLVPTISTHNLRLYAIVYM